MPRWMARWNRRCDPQFRRGQAEPQSWKKTVWTVAKTKQSGEARVLDRTSSSSGIRPAQTECCRHDMATWRNKVRRKVLGTRDKWRLKLKLTVTKWRQQQQQKLEEEDEAAARSTWNPLIAGSSSQASEASPFVLQSTALLKGEEKKEQREAGMQDCREIFHLCFSRVKLQNCFTWMHVDCSLPATREC